MSLFNSIQDLSQKKEMEKTCDSLKVVRGIVNERKYFFANSLETLCVSFMCRKKEKKFAMNFSREWKNKLFFSPMSKN